MVTSEELEIKWLRQRKFAKDVEENTKIMAILFVTIV